LRKHLGGKDNYEADREAAEQVVAVMPSILPGVRANRAFLRRAVEFLAPIAVMVLCVLQYVPDSGAPHQIISRLMDAVPPGSYLALSDGTEDIDSERGAEATARYNARLGHNRITSRTRRQIEAYFDGLDLVEPGLVPLPQWRAPTSSADPVPAYAGVGRKP
jgi:hypothetical protein